MTCEASPSVISRRGGVKWPHQINKSIHTTTAVGSPSGALFPAISEPPPLVPHPDSERTLMPNPDGCASSVPQNRRGATARHATLSLRAQGLLALAHSLPPGTSLTGELIGENCSDGTTSAQAAVRELFASGHIERHAIRNKTGKLRCVTVLAGTVTLGDGETLAALTVKMIPRGPVVYFVQRGGLIKIGTASNLKSRLSSIAAGGSMPPGMTPGPVVVLATEPGHFARETKLHDQFADDRAHGEWFHPSPALLQYIASLNEGVAA